MQEDEERDVAPTVITQNHDPEEASLEARELSKYLLAKSFFDCREYDRCAAVFLPRNMPTGPVLNPSAVPSTPATVRPSPGRTSKATTRSPTTKGQTGKGSLPKAKLPPMSQKALFLSLYAKFMAGEKRKDEESEMILGPQDGGSTMNRELGGIIAVLSDWFTERESRPGGVTGGQGWLEYL